MAKSPEISSVAAIQTSPCCACSNTSQSVLSSKMELEEHTNKHATPASSPHLLHINPANVAEPDAFIRYS